MLLEDLTWEQAEKILTPDCVVVIPLGAAAKEHGPHLKLKNDWLLAEFLKGKVLQEADVVVAPTVGYHYYPAFSEYPGSISLRLETARDLIVDICRSLAAYGAKKFYVINTGYSTTKALTPAAEVLAAEGLKLRFTNIKTELVEIEKKVGRQEGGTHADEIETSMMLYISPKNVDMKKAVKDYDPTPAPKLSRKKAKDATYSPTGIWGDPTLATRAKGEEIAKFYVRLVLTEIEALRKE